MNKYKFLAILWTALTITLSAIPGSSVKKLSFMDIAGFDKIGHFVMYAVLTFLWVKSSSLGNQNKYFWISPLLFAIFLGVLMEYCQSYFFSGRSFEWADMVANSLGALASVGVIHVLKKK